jgi:SdrD B-like domain
MNCKFYQRGEKPSTRLISFHSIKNIAFFGALVLNFLTPSVHGQVSGIVFRDLNGNGVKDANEIGAAGVTVKAYNTVGTQVGTTATSFVTTGAWSITTGTTATVRLEFSIPIINTTPGSPVANIDFSSQNGSIYGSSVQFVAGNATGVNFALNYPDDFCYAVPILATPCYINGSRAANPNDPVAILYNDDARGINGAHQVVAKYSQVGSVWGEAYNRSTKKLYLSAFIKRHMDLPPNGLGAIYEIDLTTPTTAGAGTPTLWLDINAATFVNQSNIAVNLNFPADPGAVSRGLGIKTTPTRDNWGFINMGKQGIGDIELSQDGQRLYVMDLTNRQILCIDYNTKKLIWKLAVSTPTCLGGSLDIRPWALKEYKGVLYIGSVCSGETNQNSAQLHYFIMKCNSLTAATSMTLAVDMGSSLLKKESSWNAWTTNILPVAGQSLGATNYFEYPQPIISDIEFDKDGNIILGFMDRTGHQTGFQNYFPNVTNTSLITGLAAGTITRAVNSGTSYTKETAPAAFYNTYSTTNASYDQFVGGLISTNLDQNYVAFNMIDPFDYNSNGTAWAKSSDGQPQGGTDATSKFEIVPNTGTVVDYGKANGLGDLTQLCASSPLEIGNSVWNDANKNGIHDPNETGINGVIVELYDGATKVGTTTTANGGQYYFNKTNVNLGGATEVKPNTAYTLKIAASQFNNTGLASTPLSNLTLTTANATSTGLVDVADNDATVVSSLATISYTTGNYGENNHTLDFGFQLNCPAAPSATSITICNNSTPIIPLSSLLTGAPSGGTWTRQSGTDGTFNAGAGTFTPSTGVTTSVFRYNVTGATPCPDTTTDVTITVQNCCPTNNCGTISINKN